MLFQHRYVWVHRNEERVAEVGCPETQFPPWDLPVAAPCEQGEGPEVGWLWPAGSLR